MALVVKNLPANTGDIRDTGSILGSGRSLGGGHGNLLQYSSLEDPMNRGVWGTTVYSSKESDTAKATEHIACLTFLLLFVAILCSYFNGCTFS